MQVVHIDVAWEPWLYSDTFQSRGYSWWDRSDGSLNRHTSLISPWISLLVNLPQFQPFEAGRSMNTSFHSTRTEQTRLDYLMYPTPDVSHWNTIQGWNLYPLFVSFSVPTTSCCTRLVPLAWIDEIVEDAYSNRIHMSTILLYEYLLKREMNQGGYPGCDTSSWSDWEEAESHRQTAQRYLLWLSCCTCTSFRENPRKRRRLMETHVYKEWGIKNIKV